MVSLLIYGLSEERILLKMYIREIVMITKITNFLITSFKLFRDGASVTSSSHFIYLYFFALEKLHTQGRCREYNAAVDGMQYSLSMGISATL